MVPEAMAQPVSVLVRCWRCDRHHPGHGHSHLENMYVPTQRASTWIGQWSSVPSSSPLGAVRHVSRRRGLHLRRHNLMQRKCDALGEADLESSVFDTFYAAEGPLRRSESQTVKTGFELMIPGRTLDIPLHRHRLLHSATTNTHHYFTQHEPSRCANQLCFACAVAGVA